MKSAVLITNVLAFAFAWARINAHPIWSNAIFIFWLVTMVFVVNRRENKNDSAH